MPRYPGNEADTEGATGQDESPDGVTIRERLLAAIERKPPMADLAVMFGRTLRLPRPQLERLYYGALLHEASRAGSNGRWPSAAAVGTDNGHHAEAASLMAEAVPCLRGCQRTVRLHHEHYDGSGGPERLAHGAIPLEAKVLLVAEVIDSLAQQEPRDQAVVLQRVRERLAAGRWHQFDPQVVDAAVSTEGQRVLRAYFYREPDEPTLPRDRVAGRAAQRLRRELAAWAPRKTGRRRERRIRGGLRGRSRQLAAWSLAAVAAVAIGGSGVFASQETVPGDSLYPVKRAFEDLQLLLATHDGELALHEGFAERRLQEVNALLVQQRAVPESLLAELDHETQVLVRSLGEFKGDEAYRLALRLRDLGARATSALQLVAQQEQGDGQTAGSALETASLATYLGALAVAEHDAGGGQAPAGAPSPVGAPGADPPQPGTGPGEQPPTGNGQGQGSGGAPDGPPGPPDGGGPAGGGGSPPEGAATGAEPGKDKSDGEGDGEGHEEGEQGHDEDGD